MIESIAPQLVSYPLIYGSSVVHNVTGADSKSRSGVFFRVMSRHATAMRLLLYDSPEAAEPSNIIPFRLDTGRWGDCWGIFVPGLKAGALYHFQADGPWEPEQGHRFDGRARLIDPYARAITGEFLPSNDGIVRPPKCVVIDEKIFDWEGDRPLNRPLADSVIYELHVRGFTKRFPFAKVAKNTQPVSSLQNVEASSSPPPIADSYPITNTSDDTPDSPYAGTYRGLIEAIPYLQSLGVTAVELMPIHAFAETDPARMVPRRNYWGYDSIAFFAPHPGYAADKTPYGAVREFREMVKSLHRAGIEVILDVVFNHTAEGNENGTTFSLKGLDNSIYYILDSDGHYMNFSGCGNTVNGNHPVVRSMIFDCLRHWVLNYHIDGFRFDLASILSRDRTGAIVANSPAVEAIAEDPLLADTKLIAEAWDAAGAYQVGHFHSLRWAEWNGRFRDDIRRFWRGDPGMLPSFATRFAGSSDLYQWDGRTPYHSINFVASHDGFTLNDLVSYNEKHNFANGEDNRDGDNNNYSSNHGMEGETTEPAIQRSRTRDIRNLMATLLLSQGVPMFHAGDECRRTQHGNNNAYCQDNSISWFDWERMEQFKPLGRFVRGLLELRRLTPALRRENFLSGHPDTPDGLADVEWYGCDGERKDWNRITFDLSVLFSAQPIRDAEDRAQHLLILLHQTEMTSFFTIPKRLQQFSWRLFLDTSAEPPADIYPKYDGPVLSTNQLSMRGRSMLVFVANAELP